MFKPETKILIVDDMTTMRKIVQKSLREMGFSNFVEAADGQKGWDSLNTMGPFGLVVSDWNMPNVTGIEFLKRVRADSNLKTTPFLLLTAESEVEQVKEAVVAGVDGYVVKPFTTETLKKKIEEVAKKRNIS